MKYLFLLLFSMILFSNPYIEAWHEIKRNRGINQFFTREQPLNPNRFICGETLAMFAAGRGNLDALRTLEKNNADFNLVCPDKKNLSALAIAAMRGNIECMEFLLDNGAEKNIGKCPLYMACDLGRAESVKVLLKRCKFTQKRFLAARNVSLKRRHSVCLDLISAKLSKAEL